MFDTHGQVALNPIHFEHVVVFCAIQNHSNSQGDSHAKFVYPEAAVRL